MVITDHRQGLGDLAQSAAGHGPNGGPLRGRLGHGALRHGLLKGTRPLGDFSMALGRSLVMMFE